MNKIVLIGGGSVQWTPELVNDMALTPALHGSELVLHDIDSHALQMMLPVVRRIIGQLGAGITVHATLDRREALQGANFVILCVAIGGLQAMQDDLEIPRRFGIAQAVGDTVGPGGWARGLRHIPFAVQLAQEMEELCPQAWLINLTNPMTTICRAVSAATRIRTIGLCHEVGGVVERLAEIFEVPASAIRIMVAGINHLPVILRCDVGGKDGLAMLRSWLEGRDILAGIERGEMASVFEVFNDQMAVKWTLFRNLGVLFGAGDRHVAEFFPGFLSPAQEYGLRYGVRLTTIGHRLQMRAIWQAELPATRAADHLSGEQLAPLLAALLGAQPGVFVVNVPNTGQVANLPPQVVVECQAYVDELGVRPLAVGELPAAALAVIAPHVARQEMIVKAAREQNLALAQAALATDPLITDAQIVPALGRELWQANQRHLAELAARIATLDNQAFQQELEASTDLPDTTATGQELPVGSTAAPKFSIHTSTIRQLLDHPQALQLLEKHFPGMTRDPRLKMAYGMTLAQVAPFARHILTAEKLAQVEAELQLLID